MSVAVAVGFGVSVAITVVGVTLGAGREGVCVGPVARSPGVATTLLMTTIPLVGDHHADPGVHHPTTIPAMNGTRTSANRRMIWATRDPLIRRG
jgi:hypothetical protein